MGENARDESPMTPKYTPILRVAFMQKLQMFESLVGKAKKHQIGINGQMSLEMNANMVL
jgi:hypothetical protein